MIWDLITQGELHDELVKFDRIRIYKCCVVTLPCAFQAYLDDVPANYYQIKGRTDEQEWRDAIKEEIENFDKNDTWDLVEKPDGVEIIGSSWIFRIKENPDGTKRYKARLVARGDQQTPENSIKTYSPVVGIPTLRTLLSVAVHYGFDIAQMDVKCAFLNGKIKSEVYMRQPQGMNDGSKPEKVCKLKKAIYGLPEAPRCWYEKLHSFLLKNGFQRSKFDQCLYTKNAKKGTIYILIFVNDVLIIGSKELVELTKILLQENFEMSNVGRLQTFLGIDFTRDENTLVMNQSAYIDKILLRFNMQNCKPIDSPIEPSLELINTNEENTSFPYRELLGCLNYLMMSTRPDISFAVNKLSRLKANGETIKHLKRVLRYIKGTKNLSLVYRRDKTSFPLLGYVDADYAQDKMDRKSTTGFLFTVFNNAVSWKTQKQRITALSSAESEYIAMTSAAQEGLWLKNILNDLLPIPVQNFTLMEDSEGAIAISEDVTNRSKHIDVRYYFLKEKVESNEINVKYLKSAAQPADILTKGVKKLTPHLKKFSLYVT